MKRLTLSVIMLGLLTLQVGCGPQSVSFRKSGDANATDVAPPDVSEPPCDNCGPLPPGAQSGTDLFFQTPKDARVDILIIDDNSGSMEEEQAHLATKFNTFISSLSNLDWQIGITTTDVSNDAYGLKGSLLELADNPGKKILNKSIMNADTVFKNSIARPETLGCSARNDCPSGDEQPLYASILAMGKRTSDNANFFRTGADLAILVLSDEDEMSDGPSSATKAQDVIDKFKSIWGKEKKLAAYGIIVKPGDQACLDAQRAQSSGTGSYGGRVDQLSQMTGGVTGSICDSDYSSTLQKIGQKVVQLIDAFELAHVPIKGSVKVTLTPAQNISWKTEGNKLIFAQAPSAGTRVDVSYSY